MFYQQLKQSEIHNLTVVTVLMEMSPLYFPFQVLLICTYRFLNVLHKFILFIMIHYYTDFFIYFKVSKNL